MVGQTISHYKITDKLGEGGMGVVYKAQDTSLDRPVALKFLAPHLVSDEEIRKRFEREAKAAAALNHPNVCTVHEIAEASGRTFIAMAFLEGEGLDKGIEAGPLKLKDALETAIQTAKGLQAAHANGIVHRDIKPANLMIGEDGHVTIMDFGLAQLADRSKLTRLDETMGTVTYMSPEQTYGMELDHRTDVWSLGVVIYEMVTGQQPFKGHYDKAVMYSITNEQPEPMTALRTGVPMELEWLVGKCLAKEADERYQSTADMVVDLETLRKKLESGKPTILTAQAASQMGETPPSSVEQIERQGRRKQTVRMPWAVAALTSVIAIALAFLHFTEPGHIERQSPQPATRTVVNLPDSAHLALGTRYPPIGFNFPALALSPDGRHLVYVGQAEQDTRLYHHDLTRFEDPRPIRDTDGAVYAFFPPNSSELGFLTQDRVKKVALDGGAATTLCRARTPFSANWIDATIYFDDFGGQTLNSVAAAGGRPSKILDFSQRFGGRALSWAVLPGARAALVSVENGESTSSDYNQIWVASLEGTNDKALPISGFDPRYLQSGHLVFGRGASLHAAPFDLESLELTGEALAMIESVALNSIFGQVHVTFAGNGTVAFVPGSDLTRGRLAWVDRQGNEGVLNVPEQVYGVFDVAPNDRRFAVQVADVRDYVWIWDADGGGRALPSPASVGWPVWSPDGTALAVRSSAPGEATAEVVIHDLQGGVAEGLLSSESIRYLDSWAQPGRIGVTRIGRGAAVFSVTSPGDRLWDREGASEGDRSSGFAALSPDGALIAYGSAEGTGRFQVWVEEVERNNRGQVSSDGGTEPVWCRECGELFYHQGNRFLASRITQKPQLEIGLPRVVFEAPDFVDTKGISSRVSSDGERLYYVRRSEPPLHDRIHIIHNWFAELRDRQQD